VEKGAVWARSPAEAADGATMVVTLLWDDASVEDVVGGDGFLETLSEGVHVSMSTISPACARQLAGLHARHGSRLVTAPIFGIPEAAKTRALWLPVAGPKDVQVRVQSVLEAAGAKGIFDFGEDVGAAVAVKIAGNFLIVSAAESLGQALSLAKAEGVDPHAFIDMLTKTLFPSPIYVGNGRTLAEGRNMMRRSKIAAKDLGLFAEVARGAKVETDIVDALKTLPAG